MRDLFLNHGPVLMWVITALHLVFVVLLLNCFRNKREPIALCMGLIGVGLFYDALILALGGIPGFPLLASLSRMRFISHGALIPLLFPICAYGLRARGKALAAVWVFTALVMAAGVAQAAASVLEVREVAGIVRYAASDATPAWADTISSLLSFGTVLPLIVCGVIVWVKQKNGALFLSGLLMFVFAALGPATGNMDLLVFFSMIGEVLMMLFFWLYCLGTDRKKAVV